MASTEYMPVYQGNAALGAGGGTGGGLLPDASTLEPLQKALEYSFAANTQAQQERFKMLADTTKTIALLDQEANTKRWVQKINDRDAALDAYMKGSASVKDYLPQDEPALKSARQQYDDAYTEWSKNINNPETTKKFKQAQDNLSDIAGRLALRAKSKEDQEAATASMTNPDDIAGNNKNMDSWLNGKDQNGKPAIPTIWQKFKNFNEDEFNKQAVINTTNLPSKDGLYNIPFSRFDYNKTLEAIRGSEKELGNPSTIANQYQMHYFNDVMPVADQEKKIQSINEAIDEHNASAKPEDQVPQLSVAKINGRYQLTDDPANYATKYLLAQNPDKSGAPVANEGAVKVRAELEKERHDKGIEGAAYIKADAYKGHMDALNKQIDDKVKDNSTTVAKEYEGFVNNFSPKGITVTAPTGKKSSLDAVFIDELPKSFQDIGGITINDVVDPKTQLPTGAQKIGVGHIEPFTSKDGREYYIPKYVDPVSGKNMDYDSDKLNGVYKGWKKQGYKGTYDDFFKTMLKNGGVQLVLQGKDGTANYTSMYQSAKTINAMGEGKSKENIVNPPPDEIEDNSNQ